MPVASRRRDRGYGPRAASKGPTPFESRRRGFRAGVEGPGGPVRGAGAAGRGPGGEARVPTPGRGGRGAPVGARESARGRGPGRPSPAPASGQASSTNCHSSTRGGSGGRRDQGRRGGDDGGRRR